MSKPPHIAPTGPITEGDNKINIITALGDLSEVSGKICSTINHLRDFVLETMEISTERRIILKQVQLITKASEFMNEKVLYVTSQAKIGTITQRIQSRKRAAENRLTISESKTRKAKCNYISIEDNILSKLITKPKEKVSPTRTLINPNELFSKNTNFMNKNKVTKLQPVNGLNFSLREAFIIMKDEGITPHNFYLQATDKNYTAISLNYIVIDRLYSEDIRNI